MSNYIDFITARAEKKLQNHIPIPETDADDVMIEGVVVVEKVFDLGMRSEILYRMHDEADGVLHSVHTDKSPFFWIDKKGSVKLRAIETIQDGEAFWSILEAISVEGIEALAANHSAKELMKINKFGGKLAPLNRERLYKSMSEYEKAGGRMSFEDHTTQDERNILEALCAKMDLLRGCIPAEAVYEIDTLFSTYSSMSDSEKANVIKILQALTNWDWLSVYSPPVMADVKTALEKSLVPADTTDALLRELACVDADTSHQPKPLLLIGKDGETVAEAFAKAIGRKCKALSGSMLDDEIMVVGSSRGYSNGQCSQLFTSVGKVGKYGVLIFRHLDGMESKSCLSALEELICEKKISDSLLGVTLPIEHVFIIILTKDDDTLPKFCQTFKKIVIPEYTDSEAEKILTEKLLPQYTKNYGIPTFALSKPAVKTLCAMALDRSVQSVEAKLREVLGETIKEGLDPTTLTPHQILSMFYPKEKQSRMVSMYAKDSIDLSEKYIFCRQKGYYSKCVEERIETLFALLSEGDKDEASYAKSVLKLLVNTLKAKKRSALSVAEVRKKLDESHFGLDQVKEAALLSLIKSQTAVDSRLQPILFIGPPGTGKTSSAKSIADAFQIPFFKIPLNSITDRGDLIGNKKSVENATEGMLMQAVNTAGTYRIVILLDEVDKLSDHLQNVLLNILDGSGGVYEAFCECNIDFSQVFFIGTANSIHHIAEPLKDRFNRIFLTPYNDDEKISIARDYIIPKLKKELNQKNLKFTEDAIEELVKQHCGLDGVRDISQAVDKVILKNLGKPVIAKEDVVAALGSGNSKRKCGY